jgi:4-amino-4-deoxy-L-arabinose transferase-like glycosyltransferase
MATRDFSNFFLYRWRYVIGYAFIGVLLAGLLLFAGLYLPGGLSEAEQNSVVRSAALSLNEPSTLAVQNLPYYLLQSGVFSLFGISIFTIKLPSLILALFTAVGLVLLLRRWFKPNIAVLASLIAISTGQFLFIAQSGTPGILYFFWPITLLLLGTQVTRAKKFRLLWKLLFAITAALSLYTPLGIYPLIAVVLAVAFHPHLRAVVRRLSKARLTAVSLVFLALIAPLIWFVIQTPELGLTLLGAPTTSPIDFGVNIITILKQYFLFWEPSARTVLTPVFGLGSVILIGLGLYRLILTRETTRSYLIIFWIVCLLPVLILNTSFTAVTFIPSVLVLAAGLTSLISYWYRLFPLNPYARIIGLVPIIILVGALVTSGLARYIYGYHYTPQVTPLFSKDLVLLPKDTVQLIVSNDELPFYSAVAKYRQTLEPVEQPTSAKIIVTREARAQVSGYSITRIITSDRKIESDRLYVMERDIINQ